MGQYEAWTDDDEITFGCHVGTKMKDVPADYLLYLWNNGMWRDLKDPCHLYIRNNISAIEMDAKDTIIEHDPRNA